MRFNSIRVRLAVASILWVSLATAVAGIFISQLYRTHTTRQYSIELEGHLVELADLTGRDASGRLALQRRLSDPRFLEAGSGFYWQIVGQDGDVLRSKTLGTGTLQSDGAISPEPQQSWRPGPGGPVLQVSMLRSMGGPLPAARYLIAADRRLIDQAINRFNYDLALSLSLFAVLMIIGASLQIRFGLRPVARIGNDIDDLRCGRIARLPSAVPDEFEGLVDRLNALLDAQEAIVQRSRVEAGNLAHALRTPLALVSSEAEQFGGRGGSEHATFILGQCDRMRRHIDYHLSRARAAGTRPTGHVSSAKVVVEQIFDAMRRLHAQRGLVFRMELSANLAIDCEPGDVFEMLSNLIDNAAKWADHEVLVRARAKDQCVLIEVVDDGPGIAPSLRAQVFDVGARLDEQVEGTGLGLSITRDLARLYDGDLDLSDAPGRGLKVRLLLPLAKSQARS